MQSSVYISKYHACSTQKIAVKGRFVGEYMQQHKSTPGLCDSPLLRPCTLLHAPPVPGCLSCVPLLLHVQLVLASAMLCN